MVEEARKRLKDREEELAKISIFQRKKRKQLKEKDQYDLKVIELGTKLNKEFEARLRQQQQAA